MDFLRSGHILYSSCTKSSASDSRLMQTGVVLETSTRHSRGEAPNSGVCFLLFFFSGMMLPCPEAGRILRVSSDCLLQFWALAENELLFNWQNDHLRSKESCSSGIRIEMAAGDSFYRERRELLLRELSSEVLAGLLLVSLVPCPHPTPRSCLQGVSYSFHHNLKGW